MWILWKMIFWNCEFHEKCEFENVNFVKIEICKVWFLDKCRFLPQCVLCTNKERVLFPTPFATLRGTCSINCHIFQGYASVNATFKTASGTSSWAIGCLLVPFGSTGLSSSWVGGRLSGIGRFTLACSIVIGGSWTGWAGTVFGWVIIDKALGLFIALKVVPFTLGQKSTFYPEITKNLMFEKCEFCEKWDFRIVNFVKNETLEMWILWKLRF